MSTVEGLGFFVGNNDTNPKKRGPELRLRKAHAKVVRKTGPSGPNPRP